MRGTPIAPFQIVLLLDVDFMPSFFLSEELHEQEQYTRLRERLRQGRVMVLPAFEMSRQEDGREVVHKLAQGASMDREGCSWQCVRWLLPACLLDSTHEQCKGAVAIGQNSNPVIPWQAASLHWPRHTPADRWPDSRSSCGAGVTSSQIIPSGGPPQSRMPSPSKRRAVVGACHPGCP